MATRGFEQYSMRDVVARELRQKRPAKAPVVPQEKRSKPSKYRAVKTEVDGIVFDSKREAARYVELKTLEKAGRIHSLIRQQKRPLLVYAKNAPSSHPLQKIGDYIMDFLYCECDYPHDCKGTKPVVEDVKGFKTPMYRWKKKHFEAQYGIQIREV